jgi:hypothetical protein
MMILLNSTKYLSQELGISIIYTVYWNSNCANLKLIVLLFIKLKMFWNIYICDSNILTKARLINYIKIHEII